MDDIKPTLDMECREESKVPESFTIPQECREPNELPPQLPTQLPTQLPWKSFNIPSEQDLKRWTTSIGVGAVLIIMGFIIYQVVG